MNKEVYFFDTYAIFEIIRGNPNYQKHIECRPILTVFNLAELNYNLKKEFSKKIADKYTEKFWINVITVLPSDIENAMDLKLKKKELSIPDAVGYIVSKRMGIKFLTGDNDFKDFDNIEFVK